MAEKREITLNDINNVAEKNLRQFTEFAFRKQMLNMAIAFILGTAFTKVVTAISEGLLMPIINFFIAQTNGDWRLLSITPIQGMTLEVGQFLSTFVDFVIIAFVLFLLTKTPLWKPLSKKEEEELNEGSH